MTMSMCVPPDAVFFREYGPKIEVADRRPGRTSTRPPLAGPGGPEALRSKGPVSRERPESPEALALLSGPWSTSPPPTWTAWSDGQRKLKIQYRPHLIDGCLAGTGLTIDPW